MMVSRSCRRSRDREEYPRPPLAQPDRRQRRRLQRMPYPPDANAGSEVAQQAKEADAAEKDAIQSVASAPAGGAGGSAPPGAPISISAGQTIDVVTATLGSPVRIIDLGAKKIYSYQDMKVIFMNGRVSDVQQLFTGKSKGTRLVPQADQYQPDGGPSSVDHLEQNHQGLKSFP